MDDALQILSTFNQTIEQTTDLHNIWQAAYEALVQISGEIESFLIAQVEAGDPASQSTLLKVLCWYESGASQSARPIFAPGDEPLGKLAAGRQPLAWNRKPGDSLSENDWPNAAPSIFAQRFALAALGVPLLAGEKTIGVILLQDFGQVVHGEARGGFSERDSQALTLLAAQLAARWQSVQRLDEARLQVDRARQLYEITSKIRNATDFQSILAAAAQELSLALGIRRVQIELSVEDLMRHTTLPEASPGPPLPASESAAISESAAVSESAAISESAALPHENAAGKEEE